MPAGLQQGFYTLLPFPSPQPRATRGRGHRLPLRLPFVRGDAPQDDTPVTVQLASTA